MELQFKPHHMATLPLEVKDQPDFMQDWTDSKQAHFKCGDLEFSILFGKMFYSNGIDTYEVWVLDGAHREILGDKYDQPAGYMPMDEVEEYIKTACNIWESN